MLNLANFLTFIRLLLVGPGAYAIYTQQWYWAALTLLLAIATDVADGIAARKLNQSSIIGGLFDHTTDALYVSVNLAAFSLFNAQAGLVPIWLPILIVAAFTQYVLDSSALAGKALRMSLLGRYNGIAYFVLLGTAIAQQTALFSWVPAETISVLAWLLISSTLLSMADRAWALLQLKGSI